ncbi:uncharacterized protein [Palaemon carinicauda]|uniref:uncharacterized protein n=1 Tax=Palaemon carinicauda TaxID=392227 RepID=UPI0035B6259A
MDGRKMELGISVTQSTETIVPKRERCLVEKNKLIFSIYRCLGLFPFRWDSSKSLYTVQAVSFAVAYSFWFLWPLIGLGVALYGIKTFNLNENLDQVDDVVETSIFILGFAVAPAITTYSIKQIAKYLPEILDDISNLCELKVGFKTPLHIHMPCRKQKALSSKAEFINSQKFQEHEKTLFYVPLITLFLSIVAFIIAWVNGILEVTEWSTLKSEWPFYILQFFYLTQPAITTWFCVVFIEWMRLVYEALKVEVEYLYHNTLTSLQRTSGPQRDRNIPTAAFSKESVKLTDDYIDKVQEIFVLLIKIIKYVASVNFLVYLISAVFCTLELLKSFRLIMYMIPLAISVGHMALICYASNCLMDEYEHILLILKRTVRLERHHPGLLPYDELHILRENLLELPPQVVVFGGYPLGNGFLIAVHGFILTYAVLANDIMDMQSNIPPLGNVTGNV